MVERSGVPYACLMVKVGLLPEAPHRTGRGTRSLGPRLDPSLICDRSYLHLHHHLLQHLIFNYTNDIPSALVRLRDYCPTTSVRAIRIWTPKESSRDRPWLFINTPPGVLRGHSSSSAAPLPHRPICLAAKLSLLVSTTMEQATS